MNMKMNGYRATHRNKWLLVKHGVLTLQESSLFDFLIDSMGFDKSKESYGITDVNVAEVSNLFKYDAVNSVYTKLKKLQSVGLIKQACNRKWSSVLIIKPERYLLAGNPQFGQAGQYSKAEQNQSVADILQSIGVEVQSIDKSLHSVAINGGIFQNSTHRDALDSFKVNSSSPLDLSDSKDEITPSDKEWIDDNIKAVGSDIP